MRKSVRDIVLKNGLIPPPVPVSKTSRVEEVPLGDCGDIRVKTRTPKAILEGYGIEGSQRRVEKKVCWDST